MQALCWVTLAWAVALAILCLHRNWQYDCDDAYITMRYARHLIEGHGPRWNLTGTPVEGFSSPLHLLLLAGLGWLGISLIGAGKLVGFASHALLVVFLWRFVSRRDGAVAAALVSALVIASWPMLVWDLGGLETTLFAATLVMGTLLTLEYIETGSRRGVVAGGVLFGVALFVRLDGAAVAAIAWLACAALGQRGTVKARMVDVGLAVGACVLVLLPWEMFRLAYYHAALPNTYYAKVVGIPLGWRVVSGLGYARIYARNAPFLAPMLVVVGIAVLAGRKLTRFDAGLWACIAAEAAYVIDSGGDHMIAFRFMLPLVPLMALALVRGVGELGGLKTVGSGAVVSAALLLVSARQLSPKVENPAGRDGTVLIGTVVGRYIDAHWARGSVVGVNVAGTIPYYADGLSFIDMLGLNDREIARRNPVPMDLATVKWVGHLKGDGASVFARRPDYIVAKGGTGPLLASVMGWTI